MKNKKFAEGFCFKKLFIFFVIGCLFGTYYEEILWFINNGIWTNRQGMIYGPFSPIYGLGVFLFIVLLGKNNDKRNLLKTFIFSCLIGGFSEYLTSFIADRVFGVEFWDYSNLFLNINGRTTIPYILAWGLMGSILMKLIYPFISKYIEKIPLKIGNILYYILFVFIVLDLVITYSAFGRMALRNNGVEPFTIIGKLYDKYYNNEFMYKKFPIMRPNDLHNGTDKASNFNWEGSKIIGHAFFNIDGEAYTNSKEAFLNGYNLGVRTFEVDMELSKDNKLVLIHNWENDNILTEEEFLKTKIKGKYTPLAFTDLLDFLASYPDIWIVTDTKYIKEELVKKEFEEMVRIAKETSRTELLNKLVIQIYNEEMYDTVKNIYPFNNIIFTLYQRWDGSDINEFEKICKWSSEHNIKAVTMWTNILRKEVKDLADKYNLDIYVYTENDINFAKEHILNGAKGIYTDTIYKLE